jgi:transcriptional regulator
MGDALPLLKGTLDLLILKALSVEPTHGYGVARWLEARSDGGIDADDSALYQSLHRLEERCLVLAEWGRTENNRRARFYRLSAKGRRHLEAESDTWRRYAQSVETVLGADT